MGGWGVKIGKFIEGPVISYIGVYCANTPKKMHIALRPVLDLTTLFKMISPFEVPHTLRCLAWGGWSSAGHNVPIAPLCTCRPKLLKENIPTSKCTRVRCAFVVGSAPRLLLLRDLPSARRTCR